MKITVIAVNGRADMEKAFAIRRAVFIDEQRVPEEMELDDADAGAFHALALIGGEAVGCGRMVMLDGGEVKIGRMAVMREHRRFGVGREILAFLLDAARARGAREAVLDAQLHAEGFYLKNGFSPAGDVFEEVGIPHRAMRRSL